MRTAVRPCADGSVPSKTKCRRAGIAIDRDETQVVRQTLSAEQVEARPGWVRDGEVHEIKSVDILEPRPAALSNGLEQLHGIVVRWAVRAA